jgi:hypothetical protein
MRTHIDPHHEPRYWVLDTIVLVMIALLLLVHLRLPTEGYRMLADLAVLLVGCGLVGMWINAAFGDR